MSFISNAPVLSAFNARRIWLGWTACELGFWANKSLQDLLSAPNKQGIIILQLLDMIPPNVRFPILKHFVCNRQQIKIWIAFVLTLWGISNKEICQQYTQRWVEVIFIICSETAFTKKKHKENTGKYRLIYVRLNKSLSYVFPTHFATSSKLPCVSFSALRARHRFCRIKVQSDPGLLPAILQNTVNTRKCKKKTNIGKNYCPSNISSFSYRFFGLRYESAVENKVVLNSNL